MPDIQRHTNPTISDARREMVYHEQDALVLWFAIFISGSLCEQMFWRRSGWLQYLVPIGCLFYVGICKVINRTAIVVEQNVISISHKPVPWPGRRIDLANVSSVLSFERTGKGGRVIGYEVVLFRNDGKMHTLMGRLVDRFLAESVAHKMTIWVRGTQTSSNGLVEARPTVSENDDW